MPKVINYTPGFRAMSFTSVGDVQAWVNSELLPLLSQLTEIANERSSRFENNHTSGSYEWQIAADGDLTIRQTSGSSLAISAPVGTDTAKIRTGRHWTLAVENNTAAALAVTFGSDFLVLGGGYTVAAGSVCTWTFYKTVDEANDPRLIEVQ